MLTIAQQQHVIVMKTEIETAKRPTVLAWSSMLPEKNIYAVEHTESERDSARQREN